MKAAVALAVSISLLGCFPNNARHRTYAKVSEGVAVVGGIVISAIGNTGADCDQMTSDDDRDSCRSSARLLSTIGVVLILGGLLGFVATISTAQDDAESTPRVISREKTDGSGPTPPPGSGSGAGTTPGGGTTTPTEDAPGDGTTTPGATEGSAAPSTGGGGSVPAPNQFQWAN